MELLTQLLDILDREFIYLAYYFEIQFNQIFPYWVLGMVIGSLVSVFAKDTIHRLFDSIKDKKWGIWGVIPASMLGIASPLCMYGTIPIAASFSRHGMRHDWLAAFMMSSVLLNPQLLMYSASLGNTAVIIRLVSCTICGIVAGWLVGLFYKDKPFFDFTGFEPREGRDTDPNLIMRFLKNLWRNVKATGGWFLLGLLLSVAFQRYVPQDAFVELFGEQNEGFGVLMAATIGVPLYACGGGTIPLLRMWLASGMSMGSASAFMITGPATKITNLGALKIVMGMKRFLLYIAFVMIFSLATGLLVDMVV